MKAKGLSILLIIILLGLIAGITVLGMEVRVYEEARQLEMQPYYEMIPYTNAEAIAKVERCIRSHIPYYDPTMCEGGAPPEFHRRVNAEYGRLLSYLKSLEEK